MLLFIGEGEREYLCFIEAGEHERFHSYERKNVNDVKLYIDEFVHVLPFEVGRVSSTMPYIFILAYYSITMLMFMRFFHGI